MRSRRKKQRNLTVLAIGLGGACAIIAGFAYLERTSSLAEPAAEPSPPLTAVLIELKPAADTTPPPETIPDTAQTNLTPKTEAPSVTKKTQPPETLDEKPAAPEIAHKPDASPLPSTPALTPRPVASASKPAPALLVNEEPMILVGIESTRDAALKRRQELMERAANDRHWSVYRPLLKKSLDAAFPEIKSGHGVSEFAQVWEEPVFYQALLQWKTLSLFPPTTMTESAGDSYSAQFFLQILQNNAAMEELLLTMRPEDDPQKVLHFLKEAWMNNNDQYDKYFNLTLACAVVFDEEISIPNLVGDMDEDFYHVVDPIKRHSWYIDKNEKGKLEAPVDRSSARDLIWVVNAPVPESELDWAISNIKLRRKSWGRTYGNIEYLMERAVEGLNPYKEYSFEEIEDEGGICGDQTYYCVNTARAKGIPAINLSGETNRGRHAWAAIKVKPDEWDTKVGRIDGVSKGQARNPQTGKMITEQEIQLWNDRDHKSKSVLLGIARHLWLASLLAETDHKEQRVAAVKIAHKIGETFPETWTAIYQMLVDETTMSGKPEKPDNLKEWQSFVSDMRRKFRENPRFMALAAEAEDKYIFPYIPESDARRAMLRERRQIERYAKEQVDLIAQSLKREADLIAKGDASDKEKQISQLYDKALKDYGSSIPGFKIMARDYHDFFAKDKEQAAKATRNIELAFKRVIESGDNEYFRAQTEAGILKMICGFYRACGEEKRADLLEKRYERDLRRATRGAL